MKSATCKCCGVIFVQKHNVCKDRPRKYCSRQCAGKALRRDDRPQKPCIHCGGLMTRRLNDGAARWAGRKFCSSDCSRQYRIGSRSANWKGGRSVTDRYIRLYDGPRRGRVFEHRQKAEKALGRKLGSGEIVHHVDCEQGENRNNNLLICDRAYHKWLHDEMGKRYAQEHFGVRSFASSEGLLF